MKQNRQKYTPVRFSHLTSYAGIGAIVRGVEDRLMVLVDTRYWRDMHGEISTAIPYVTRITAALNIDKELHMPPQAKETHQGLSGNYLPAILFPRYAVCKKCGLLHNGPWTKQQIKHHENVYCQPGCNGILEQVTWCAVSSKGHLAEVPWHYICHLDSTIKCEIDYDSEYLELTSNQNGKRMILCRRCHSQHFFENHKGLTHINQHQPWIFEGSPELGETDTVEILEVNNPGVYIPERVNALVIPPESRISQSTVVDKLYRNSKLCRDIDAISINTLRRKSKIREVARELKTSASEIEQAFVEINKGYPWLDDFTVNDLYEDEYQAFLKPLEDQKEDEDFVTEHHTDQWKALVSSGLSEELTAIVNSVELLVAARRLREIQVFKGFYRITSEDKENCIPPDITGDSHWLPAIELFGEGVFFTLNEALLQEWENTPEVVKRADEIKQRYEKAQIRFFQDIEVTPRFILLHTLSHLMVRELEATAGYPAASLKERIYSSRAKKMAGILVYTAVPDIAGSLGGIINSAEPGIFLAVLDNVFKKAQWCSLDPVCTEHEGQGPGWLNRAACHACSLIPEPGCEHQNVFLDRVFIKGSTEKAIPAFLDFAV